jgi:hypothetical protein
MSAATGARVALRVRSGLEGADLGVAMARAWWRPLATTWLVFVLPVAVVIVWLLRDAPLWALGVLWWLRPAFARIPLHVLALELFGEHATLAGTARALPRLLSSGLLGALTLQRFSFARTFLQPVLQLEGLRGAERRARAAVLTRGDAGVGALLAVVFAALNGALIGGLLLFVALVTPTEMELDVFAIVAGDEAVPGVLPALYLAGVSVIEPLLVACGFALYVNRRVYLEGWEIELAFRRLAARENHRASAKARRFGAAAAALLALWLAAPPAHAGACVPDDPSSAAACIDEVLADPAFGGARKELRWMPKEWDLEPEVEPPFLAAIAAFLARSAQVILYAGLALAIVGLLFALRGVRLDVRREPDERLPRTFMGLDLDPRSLPPDVVGAAREAWARGERIAALSLLYRGALVRLGARGALDIPESATEFECLRAIRRTQAEAIASAFGSLTHSWIGARYAHAPPNDREFDALCAAFGAFEGAA